MKAHFTFNGHRYISPTKREARHFLSYWKALKGELSGSEVKVYRLHTEWRIRHVELAPSYAQMMSLDLSQVEY